MTDIATIGIRADITDLQNAVRELNRLADQGQRTERSITSSMGGIGNAFASLTAAISGAAVANKVVDYADAWKQANAQIRQVTDSEAELITVRSKLVAVSNDTRTSLESTIQLYANLDRATESLGVSSEEVLGITKTINNLFLAGGKGSAAAAAGITQLSQAFASGVLRGDEFNSVAENAPRILDALSAKLGKTRGELRAMAEQGKLTAGILAEALTEYSDEAQALAETTEKTFGQSIGQASDNVLQFVGTSKGLNEAVNSLGAGIESASANLDKIADAALGVALVFGVKIVSSMAASAQATATATIANVKRLESENAAAIGAARRAEVEKVAAIATLERARSENAAAVAAINAARANGTSTQSIGALILAMNAQVATQARLSAATIAGAEASAVNRAAQAALTASNATLATSATVAGVAMRGLNATMALVGGPLGAAIIAGAAIYYFATRATDAEKAVEKLNPSVEGLTDRFNALGNAQKTLVSKQYLKDIEEQKKIIDELGQTVEFVSKASAGAIKGREFLGLGGLDEAQAELEGAKNKLAELQKQFNEISPPNAKFNDWLNSIVSVDRAMGVLVNNTGDGVRKIWSMFESPPKVEKVSDTFEKMSKEIEKRIALFGKEGKAAELIYDIQKGNIKDLKAGEEALLVAMLKREDAMASVAEKQKEAADKAKDIAEKELSRVGSINSMISAMARETDLMGEQSKEAQIRYDIEHGLIEVLGGVNGLEAQSLLNAARLNDEKRKQIELDKQLEDKLADDIMRNSKGAIDAVAEWGEKSKKEAEEISRSLTDALMRGFESGKGFAENMKDTVKNMFSSLVLKPVIQPLMDKASGAIQGAIGGLSAGANMAIAGAAIVGSLWNDYMEKGFQELTSEFRQSRQSTGTLLGNANAKSESISKALSEMGDNGSSLLDVNHGMYQALLDIKTGISGSAAGFARQSLGGNAEMGIKTGTSYNKKLLGVGSAASSVGGIFGSEVGGFVDSIVASVSKALYGKKTSIIDSGIQIIGGTLADTLAAGMVGAMNYAEVQTTKKVLGLTTSNKVKTQTSDLDEAFKIQFAQVFEGAGKALEEASKVFGSTFDASKLMIDATKLSLKGLEGDALTKEIESFFSGTLDKWANGLVGSLTQFQQVGEGAFETMIRLASQTNIFTSYAEKLLPKFELVGMAAINATQSVAELSGGFDRLNTNMGSYYNNFFDESEKSERGLTQVSEALAGVGLAMPKTRDEFRAMVESLDLTSESQQKQYAALLDVNQAFAQFVPAAKSAKDATTELTDSIDKIADQQKTLSDKLFDLTANDAQKRQALLDATLSDENRAIQERIFAAEDNAERQKKFREEDAARISKHYNDQASLQKALFDLTHSQEEILAQQRKDHLATLDKTNKAIQEQVWAIEDAASANQKLAEEAGKAAQEAQAAADVIANAMKAANDERVNLEKEYFNLTATEQQKRQAQLASLLSDEARDVQNKIYGYQDAQSAAEAAAKASEDAIRAAQESADARIRIEEEIARKFEQAASERYGLETQLLQAQGKTQELRERELATIDESNRPLQEQIWAIEDAAKANQALADAVEKAAQDAQAAADIIANAMKAANDERMDLEKEYFNLTATEQEKRVATLSALLSDEARDVQNKIYAYTDAQKAAEDSAKAQEEAIKAGQDASRAAQEAADEQARLIKGTQDALTGAIRKMRGESEQLNDIDRQRAKNTLNAALAAAQSGKSIIGFAGLEDALDAVSTIDKSKFTSAEDYQRELGRTLSILDRLSGYAGVPGAPTTPIIGNSNASMQSQTNQQMAQNMAALEDQMTKLTVQIEDNTKRTKMMLERWEAIGMPVSRTA